jgi:hypothetical protein
MTGIRFSELVSKLGRKKAEIVWETAKEFKKLELRIEALETAVEAILLELDDPR